MEASLLHTMPSPKDKNRIDNVWTLGKQLKAFNRSDEAGGKKLKIDIYIYITKSFFNVGNEVKKTLSEETMWWFMKST
jgi:hypothetical protein